MSSEPYGWCLTGKGVPILGLHALQGQPRRFRVTGNVIRVVSTMGESIAEAPLPAFKVGRQLVRQAQRILLVEMAPEDGRPLREAVLSKT